jgi:hypothetical protein
MRLNYLKFLSIKGLFLITLLPFPPFFHPLDSAVPSCSFLHIPGPARRLNTETRYFKQRKCNNVDSKTKIIKFKISLQQKFIFFFGNYPNGGLDFF